MMNYTQFDKTLANNVLFLIPVSNIRIEFQFPPKITTDSRKGEWSEENMAGTEPLATYIKSGPREISLAFTYIVDGGLWTTTRISTIVSTLRSYFAKVKTGADRKLVVRFGMWRFGGDKAMSFRIKGIDVKHSDTIVSQTGNYKDAYALRTDVVVDLRMWTQGSFKEKTVDIKELEPSELPGWY